MDPEYQEQHLQFVATNNNGSTIMDIVMAGWAKNKYVKKAGLWSVDPDPRSFYLQGGKF